MLRQLTGSAPVCPAPATETAARIACLHAAYGADTAFLRFYGDGNGITLALMDGVALLDAPARADLTEAALFLHSQPVVRVRGDAAVTDLPGFIPAGSGRVLAAGSVPVIPPPAGYTVESLPPRTLYAVLTAAFGKAAPAFEGWYVDVSHRMRHGVCRTLGALHGGEAVACAMTVAETPSLAVIGGVGTSPAYRRRGLASACITALTAALRREGRTVLIAPQTNETEALYRRLGFVPAGDWSEVIKES